MLNSLAVARAPLPLPDLYERVRRHILPDEWPAHAEDIEAILAPQARTQRRHPGAQLSDSRDLPDRGRHRRRQPGARARGHASRCRRHRACRRALHGGDGKAPQSRQDRPDPGPQGGLLARRIDHRRRRAPAAAAISRRSRRHLCEHFGGGEGRVGHLLHVGKCRRRSSKSLGVRRVIMLPDEFLARNIAAEVPEVEIIAWSGHCEVHERSPRRTFARCARAIPASSCSPIRNARRTSSQRPTSPVRPLRLRTMSREAAAARRADDRMLDERQHRCRAIPKSSLCGPAICART